MAGVWRRRPVIAATVVVVAAVALVVSWPHLMRYVGSAPPTQFDQPDSVSQPVGAGAKVLGIAHNAGNNLDTLDAALRAGADVIEIDVISAQGRLVAGREHYPWPGLARALFRGPTLEDAWRAAAGAEIKLDLKQQDAPFLEQVVSFLRSHAGDRRVLVSTPDRASLLLLHERLPEVTLLASVSDPPALERLRADPTLLSAVGGLSAYQGLVTADLVTWAHARGLVVLAWTVDGGSRLGELVRLGVDGITTANLAVLRALRSTGRP